MTNNQVVIRELLNGIGFPKREIGLALSVSQRYERWRPAMIYRVQPYRATFDDNQHDRPGLETVCQVVADGLVKSHADAEAMLTQLRLLCTKHRPVIIAAFLPSKPLKYNTVIESTYGGDNGDA